MESLYFSPPPFKTPAKRFVSYGAMTELYKVPVAGGRTEQVLATPAEWVCFDKSGKNFLYQDRKGFEDEWRKHHTSSITRDIWLYNTQTGKTYELDKPGRGGP